MLIPSVASASDPVVNVVGQRSSGHYYVGDHVFRTFAGTFAGDFTPEDCLSAAQQIADKFQTSDQKVDLRAAANVQLRQDERMLVLGMQDETANRWVHACINMASSKTAIYRYDLGNGPFFSDDWVVRHVTYEGQRYTIQFADDDRGGVVFDFYQS
jgi:hypothetical protein